METESQEGGYYIQRHASGLADGCVLFWRLDDRGYTTDINSARVFCIDDAKTVLCDDLGHKYTAWPSEHIEAKAGADGAAKMDDLDQDLAWRKMSHK
jgi:hypothetical protein